MDNKIEIRSTGIVKDIDTYEIKIIKDFSDYMIDEDDDLYPKGKKVGSFYFEGSATHSDIDGYIDISLFKKIDGKLCSYVNVFEENPEIIDQNYKKAYITVVFEDIVDGSDFEWECSDLLLSYDHTSKVIAIKVPLLYM
ncbi:MAG: hypothetical protein R3Y09_02290 [Clostridia bacterium]